MYTHIHTEREAERDRERQRDRDRERYRDRERQRERQRERGRDRERETAVISNKLLIKNYYENLTSIVLYHHRKCFQYIAFIDSKETKRTCYTDGSIYMYMYSTCNYICYNVSYMYMYNESHLFHMCRLF